MAYATIADVEARFPTQLWEATPASQPTRATVDGWLEADGQMIQSAFAWKYVLPISEPSDLATLRQANADLTASRVWRFIAGYDDRFVGVGEALAKTAFASIGYDPKTGRASLVLTSTALSDSGEAAVDIPEGTFTDPLAEWGEQRLFTIGMEY